MEELKIKIVKNEVGLRPVSNSEVSEFVGNLLRNKIEVVVLMNGHGLHDTFHKLVNLLDYSFGQVVLPRVFLFFPSVKALVALVILLFVPG